MKKSLLMLVLALAGTGWLSAQTFPDLQIPNGLYLILSEHSEVPEAPPEKVLVPFSHAFLDSNTIGQPIYLEIDTAEFVRFELAREPMGIEQPDQRINLLLTLNNSASEQLAHFTEKHLNERVAIIIGNKAVTKHKVRTRIDGGKLQITRCTDNACEHLLLELRENYRE